MYHICKRSGDHELTTICAKYRCPVVLMLLSLIQKIHLDYHSLLENLELATSKEFVEIFRKRMLSIIDSKYMGLLDLFESLDQLTLTGHHFVHRSSLFGVFLRRMFLQYQRMSFTDTGNLGKSVESYLQLSRSDEIHSILPSTDTADRQSYRREDLQYKMESLSEVDRFIATQTKLIELHRTNALPPRELHNRIQEIIHNFPPMMDAYYLSYLNQLHVGEVRSALFDLHRYFDYKKWADDEIGSDAERTSLEKHQMKFKRFRYCALNLGIFHFHHGHYEISRAAFEEAIKMAQETNDSYCLLHAMFWLYQLNLEFNHKLAKSMLAQLNRKAKELGVAEFQILGSLLQCKSEAFGGDATFQGTIEKLKEIDCASSAKAGIATGKIEVAKSALLDFYGYRTVSSMSSQMVLSYLRNSGDVINDHAVINDHSDPESSILAVCQLARCLADEGLYSETEKVLSFGSSLIPEHSNHHKWLSICKWQLYFDRSVIRRDLESAEDAVNHLQLYDKEDASFRGCVLEYLLGNCVSASSKVDSMLEDAEARLCGCVGYTPGSVHTVRLLQLKAELYASSNEFSRAITYLTKATDICRRFQLRTLEAETAISTAHCMIFLGLPRHAKQIMNEYMVSILSNGTLYAKSMAFLVHAKASLFSLKGNMHSYKSELLELLLPLERSIQGCQRLEASAATAELLYTMAHVSHVLDYTSKRNIYAKEFRLMHEEGRVKQLVKLFV